MKSVFRATLKAIYKMLEFFLHSVCPTTLKIGHSGTAFHLNVKYFWTYDSPPKNIMKINSKETQSFEV